MQRPGVRLGLAVAIALTLVLGAGARVRAAQFHVHADTVADGYQLVTADDELLNRRRLHQYLGLGVYDLLSDGGYQLSLVTLFRFDAELARDDDEREQIERLEESSLSVQVAYLRGRGLFGFLDVDAGRFLHADAIDYLLLDGVRLVAETPWYLGVELLAGLEAKEDTALVTDSQQELDGVRFVEDRFDNDTPTVALGVGLVIRNLWATRGRIAYRRLLSDGAVDQDKVGAALYQRIGDGLHLRASGSYDLFRDDLDRLEAGVRYALTDAWEVDGQFVRLLPSFDADSIFNIFSSQPLNDGNLRVRWALSDQQRLHLAGMLRFFGNEPSPLAGGGAAETSVKAYGASAGYFHGWGEHGHLAADASWEDGYGGRRVLLDLRARWGIVPHRWELDGRLTGVVFDSDLQPNLEGVGGGYQLGGRYLVDRRAAISVVVEHNFNRIHPSQLRVWALADIDVWL